MAIIYSYPQVKPKTTDLLIGTVTYDATGSYPVDGNPTRTFSVQDIANLAASYTLTTEQNGTSSTLTLKSDAGSLSVVNLLRGNGISLNSNGSNSITIGNLGVLSANASNTNFINMTPSAASTGNVTFSASLSASGNAGSSTYLRGDNTWSTPVTTVSTASTTFINLTPISALNGDVQISAALSATGIPTSSNFLRGDNQWAVPAGGGTVTSVNSGTGISVDNTDPDNPIINNTGVLSNIAGTGISISGATGNSTITNTAPDQTVVITGSGGATVTGAYPNFNISTTDNEGVETIVAGTAISVDSTNPASPIVNNLLPDQTVVITGSGDTTVTGTYPTFNISSDSGVTQIVAGNDISISPVGGTGIVTINSTSQGGVTSLIAGDNITLSPVSGLGDVTVNAPGLIPYTETSTANIQFVSEDVALGGGSSSDTVVPSQLAVKTYVDNAVVGGLIYQGSYDASTNTPVLDSRGTQIAVTQGWTYTVTVDGTFYGETVKVGDVLIAETDLAAGTGALTDWTTVQSNIDLATAGTDATAVRGLAGFDTDNFTVVNGFVNLKVGDIIPSTLVTSVNTQVGAVVLDTDDIAEGATNLYDKTVVITGSGGATITGAYPNFNVDTTDATGVDSIVAGTAISVDATDPSNPILTNTAPDQTVTITGAGDTVVTGTYPNFTVTSTSEPIPTVLPSDFVFINVKNETGNTIPLGTGLMAVGTDGNSGHILVAPMVADGSVEPKYYIGVLEEELLNGELGRAVTQGEVNQINTNAFLDSDILWCDPANPGGFTKTEPSAPNLKISTAIVLNSSTNGKIFVRVQGNEGLHELHDVGISSQTNKQVLAWNDTAGYWQNQDNLYSLTAGTGLDGGTITTTGTISLANTAVTPGAYTNANITVDQQGRITLASNGDPGGVTSFTASNGTFITLTPNTSQTGAATLAADLSASGTSDSTTFLRGDNAWSTAVTGLTVGNSSFINLSNVGTSNVPDVTATLSANGTPDSTTFLRGDNTWSALPVAQDNTRYVNTETITSDNINYFIISVIPISKNNVDLYISGIYQSKTLYSVSNNVVTLNSGFFPNGALVETVTTGTDPNIPLPVLSLTSDINTITADNNNIKADQTYILE